MTMMQTARRFGRVTAMRGAAAMSPARMGAAARQRARTIAMVARLGAVGAMAAAASPALAQDLSPIATMLDTVVTAMTGPIGVALAVLAIVGTGMACLFGRLNFGWLGAAFAGVVLMFSAETIVNGFAGGGD